MNERTDLGWWINGVDQPAHGLSNPSFINGEFSATTTNTNPNIYWLESGNPFAAKLGKIGTNYPIDADTYKFVVIRMSVDTGATIAQFIYNRDTIYDTTTTTAANVPTTPGYRIYLVDITSLNLTGAGKIPWSGLIRSLRMNLTFAPAGEHIKIDWGRLVNSTGGSAGRSPGPVGERRPLCREHQRRESREDRQQRDQRHRLARLHAARQRLLVLSPARSRRAPTMLASAPWGPPRRAASRARAGSSTTSRH